MKKVVKILLVLFVAVVVSGGVAVVVMARQGAAMLSAPDTPYPNVSASSDPAIIARGEYIVRTVGHCSQCHASGDRDRPETNTPDRPLSGGLAFAMGPLGTL